MTTLPKPHPLFRAMAPPRSHRALKAAGAALLTALTLCAVVSSAAVATECPNEQLRLENHSTTLPNCRAYEQMTPPYKQGIRAENTSLRADGNSMDFSSTGNFAGNEQGSTFNDYRAQRSTQGWTTEPTAPRDSEYESEQGVLTSSADQTEQVLELRRLTQSSYGRGFYLRRSDGTIAEIGPITDPSQEITPPGEFEGQNEPEFIAASGDLSHIVYLPFASTLDEYVGTGNVKPRVVNQDNSGTTIECVVNKGNGPGAPLMSRDAQRIFYSCVGAGTYARIAGVTTVALSASQCTRTAGDPGGACNEGTGASVEGFAEDGSVVYFTTRQQLVNADVDEGLDLYACKLPAGAIAPQGNINPCPYLEPVTVTGNPGGAGVVEVLHVSNDGSRVAFVATGVLSGANSEGGSPVQGAHNLYVFEQDETGGHTTFLADLCSGSGMSGAASDAQCPAAEGASDPYPGPQMTPPSGHFIAFTTYARLDAGDTDQAQDVYRYDAERGSLIRVSLGHAGYSDNGNAAEAGAELPFGGRTISDNGARVFFRTAEALTPQDTNGQTDVYEWENGQVDLISDGVDPNGTNLLQASSSGDDVIFETLAQLTWSDGDTTTDVYDARVDGGFAAPVAVTPCIGEACQGASPSEASLAVPGSATLTGFGITGGGLSTSPLARLTVRGSKTFVGSSGLVKIDVSGKGGLTVSGDGLKKARTSVPRAGVVTVRVVLTSNARARLKAKGLLKTRLKVVFVSGDGTSSSTSAQFIFKESQGTHTHSQSGSPTRKGHS